MKLFMSPFPFPPVMKLWQPGWQDVMVSQFGWKIFGWEMGLGYLIQNKVIFRRRLLGAVKMSGQGNVTTV